MAKFTGLFDAEYEHKKEPHQQKTNHARFMMLKNKEKHGKQTIHGKRRKQVHKDVLPGANTNYVRETRNETRND